MLYKYSKAIVSVLVLNLPPNVNLTLTLVLSLHFYTALALKGLLHFPIVLMPQPLYTRQVGRYLL